MIASCNIEGDGAATAASVEPMCFPAIKQPTVLLQLSIEPRARQRDVKERRQVTDCGN